MFGIALLKIETNGRLSAKKSWTITTMIKGNYLKGRDYRSPERADMSDDEIISRAHLAADELDYLFRGDLNRCVKNAGGEVVEGISWTPTEVGKDAITINSDGSFKIFLLDNTPGFIRNFTIAHELGHFFLHFLNGGALINSSKCGLSEKPLHATRFGSGPEERQANIFAINFLLPDSHLIEAEIKNPTDCIHLAEKTGIEPYIILRKAQKMEIL